ncbi:putative inorganic phosphate cotransporter isoform X1 [Onthophagus taurus]|uniref:putative inorganic phosphate cotransporter isoform X1 n=2 Tax=Onthophagus taurus TaxID=166361 RepID=UPI0039BDB2BF
MLLGWKKSVSKTFLIPQRYVIAIMGFFAIFNAYTMRICLSVAITEMVLPKNSSSINHDDTCPNPNSGNKTIMDTDNLYDWSETRQGLILSSFYWGYVITHLPGGILAGRYGGKYLLNLGILSTAIFTLLTPIVVEKFEWQGLITLRALEGLGEGTTYPAVTALLARWVPLGERARMSGIVFSGSHLGTVIGNVLSGYLIEITGTWSSVFYVFGVIGIIWFLLSLVLTFSDPENHPFISDRERLFLKDELSHLHQENERKIVPWRSILTSIPLWSLVIVQIGHDWGFFSMVTDLPKYMSDVMKFNVGENGLWSSLPYIVMWIVAVGMGYFSDYCLKKNWFSISFARKFFTTIASIGPGIFIVAASYAECNRALAVSLFTISMGFMGPYFCSTKVNALDLSPNYAGITMAIVNGLGAVSGIITPYLIGALTEDHTLSQWRLVFWITLGVLAATNLQYLYFGTAKTQWWDQPPNENNDKCIKEKDIRMTEVY